MSDYIKMCDLLNNIKLEEIVKHYKGIKDPEECRYAISYIIGFDNQVDLFVDKVLEAFLNNRVHERDKHSSWIHALLHLQEYLWGKSKKNWIKKFNQIAFQGAIEFDHNFVDANAYSLLMSFQAYSKWYDHPSDYGLTEENLVWVKDNRFSSILKRVKRDGFKSEEEFNKWNKNNPPLWRC